jgi:3-hexulose-6-phosphate synthase
MSKKIKISPNTILDRFSSKKSESIKSEYSDLIPSLSTPQISDALRSITGENGVIKGLKSVNNQKIFGKVVTARTKDYDWGTSVKAIDAATEGEVLFILTEGEDSAVWGELTSQNAKMKGIAGTIIYGACRDLDGIKNLNFPVFSLKIVPNAGSPLFEGLINIPLKFGKIEIQPGDYVFGDESGVVLVSQENFEKVMKKAKVIKDREKTIITQIKEGKSLSDILEGKLN